jgi:hypothetical protein
MTSMPPLTSTDASLSLLSPAAAGVQAASPAARAGWFDGMVAGDHRTGLRAETEPQARGLSAAQHAERVLQHLVDGS